MSGKKSLYDLLEVSNSASAEAIRASFDRLTVKYDSGALRSSTGLDADAYYNLIKDAYFTLGNPAKRQAYDQRLLSSNTSSDAAAYYDDAPAISTSMKLLIAVLVVATAIYALKMHRDGQIETARLLAEAQQAALLKEALAHEQQQRAQALDLRQDRNESDEARRARVESERARAEAEQNSRRLARTEEQYRREDERKRSDAERKQREEERRRQSDARELQNRAEQDRQRIIRSSQQQDYGRPAGAAIEHRPDTLSPNRR